VGFFMDDLEFVRKCTKGDKQSWEVFVNKYSRLIYNYICSVLKVKGIDLLFNDNVNDLFQEVFLMLTENNFKKLKSFKGKNGCSLASWLRQIVINRTIDYVRKLRPHVSIEEENDDGLNIRDILLDTSAAINDKLIFNEKVTTLKDCIEMLDIDDKFFLDLHIHQGIPLEEIKDYFELTRGSVDMRKSRIIDRLRDCFKQKGFSFISDQKPV